MITLHLRYTIDPNKLSDIRAYAEAEQKPIQESGGKIIGYFLPTDFAGATNEAFGVIDFPSLAEYEIYRAKLAAHPLHIENAEALQRTDALLSIQRSLIQRVEPTEGRDRD
jgi:NIPSNAP